LKKSPKEKSLPDSAAGEEDAPRISHGRRLRHRVVVANRHVFGPGKADLLEGIEKTGSLAAAARAMKMSYMRAWRLVQEMKEFFAEPLIEMQRGGRARGGAKVTAAGKRVLRLYRRMENEALEATETSWKEFAGMINPAGSEPEKRPAKESRLEAKIKQQGT
jgi:molybdate transport system regulatory protein